MIVAVHEWYDEVGFLDEKENLTSSLCLWRLNVWRCLFLCIEDD